MKKLYKTLFFLILFVFICSCKSTDENVNSNSYKDASSAISSFCEPRSITENQAIFADLIKNNPIDKAYLSAKSDGTVQGMMDIENEFADIWTSELEYSIETFTALLNEDDKAEFKLIQKNWEQNLTNSRTFLDEIFNNDEYQVYTGRMFLVEEAAEYKNEIRRRTLYVKYLQFNMEQSEDFIVNFEWNNTVQ